jgi:hypothetical protein
MRYIYGRCAISHRFAPERNINFERFRNEHLAVLIRLVQFILQQFTFCYICSTSILQCSISPHLVPELYFSAKRFGNEQLAVLTRLVQFIFQQFILCLMLKSSSFNDFSGSELCLNCSWQPVKYFYMQKLRTFNCKCRIYTVAVRKWKSEWMTIAFRLLCLWIFVWWLFLWLCWRRSARQFIGAQPQKAEFLLFNCCRNYEWIVPISFLSNCWF